ncbi:MAG: DEAD/DEAH box helicase [Bdellovibrionaceae bacterium]|nr:DEAD/DEAH box helicase [Pseudobdellovibrionaceae bacterium]
MLVSGRMSFSSLGLHSDLLERLKAKGFDTPTPIQNSALPLVIKGKDVAGLARTGTGKTAAYVLPLLHRILNSRANDESLKSESFSRWTDKSYILILVPTRELAFQVQDNIKEFSTDLNIHSAVFVGGLPIEKDVEALQNSLDFIIATPGRLIDLYKNHSLHLGQVEAVALDEADRLFDMGFADDVKYILTRIPKHRQFLLFSATLSLEALYMGYEFGAQPVELSVSKREIQKDLIEESLYHISRFEKSRYLLSLLKSKTWRQAIVFSNYKNQILDLEVFLSANGIKSLGLSSVLTQARRNKVITEFKSCEEKMVLIATDVAARGLDIEGVDLVINYDIPQNSDPYIHRIGRTGRAGSKGEAISLVSDKDAEWLVKLEEDLKIKIPIGWIEDKDLVTDFVPYKSSVFIDSSTHHSKHVTKARRGNLKKDAPKKFVPSKPGNSATVKKDAPKKFTPSKVQKHYQKAKPKSSSFKARAGTKRSFRKGTTGGASLGLLSKVASWFK